MLLVRLSTAGHANGPGLPELDHWVLGKAVVAGLGVCIVGGGVVEAILTWLGTRSR